jgi:hypothetical protein
MPRTQITTTVPARTGTAWPSATACDVANGNYTKNNGHVFIYADNTGGAPYTLDFTVQQKVDGITPDFSAVSITNGTQKIFGPFPVAIYGDELQYNGENAAVEIIAIQAS